MESSSLLPYYLALIAGIVLGVVGQVSVKIGAERSGDLVAQFLNPFTISGFAIYAIASLFYVVSVKKLPLSIAYPSVSLSYGVVALIAHWLWNEPFGTSQVLGLLLIGGGIVALPL
jgi:multidrug transporter EmrE-like cation transporter